ncbi:MAG: hypothetical protein IH939_04100 [Acidobacteria bacterium]|nr:hypothetical protein [Acidobacteriota bacterium]
MRQRVTFPGSGSTRCRRVRDLVSATLAELDDRRSAPSTVRGSRCTPRCSRCPPP